MTGPADQPFLPTLERPREAQTGIWPAQRIAAAIESGQITADDPVTDAQVQPASLDLRLGDTAYRLPASFLPGPRATVAEKVRFLAEETVDLTRGAMLKRGEVYVVKLQEELSLRRRQSGFANPKSSTGRLDVFARLITDQGTEFDTVRDGYKGPLWLEIAPRSFNVVVRRGSRLSQVRLRQGTPLMSEKDIRRLHEAARLVHDEDALEPDIKQRAVGLSVDVEGDPATGLVGYRARRVDEPVDFDRIGHYDVDVFWDRIHRPERGGIVLHVDEFHILATKERVAVPVDHAADMAPYDTRVGEFRVHYAGFFDPGFGFGAEGSEGTTIVLEIRSHEVPFMMEHGQMVGRVLYERLTEPTDRPYGTGIGSSYYRQALTLAKQFKRVG